VEKIFEKYFGAHPSVYGIKIIVLGSVDVATGSKKWWIVVYPFAMH